MPIIGQEPSPTVKANVSVRISSTTLQLLDRYCEFIHSGRAHVIEQALLYTFDQDAEFQQWLETAGPQLLAKGQGA